MKEISTPFVSIIMPVRFRTDLARMALDSVFLYTPEKIELIVVLDEAGKEGEELMNFFPSIYKVIRNEKSLGYVGSVNKAFQLVDPSATHIMTLNSDVVCSPDWMRKMLSSFEMDNKIGLVAPTFTGTSHVQSVDFNHRFGEYLYVDEVIGVCMLLKRELVDDLLKNNERFGLPEGALLDPMFGVGGADDNDLSMRIYQLGWKSLINRKAFIYHYVSATFKELYKGNASAFMEYGQKSLDKFRSKWKKELEEMEKNIEKMPVLFCCDDIGVKYKDKLGELKKLKEKYPSLKVNAFVVAKDIDETVIEFLKQDWIEVNVHAYEHDGIPELNFEDKADRIKKAVEELDEVLPEKMGYRAPGFRLTASTYPILKMLGFSHIVHQNRVQLLNEQKVISNIPLINTHIYEDLNKNNYEKCNFKFISEVI